MSFTTWRDGDIRILPYGHLQAASWHEFPRHWTPNSWPPFADARYEEKPFWSLVFGSCQLSVPSFELWMEKQPGATNLLDRGPFSLGHQVFCCLPRVGQVVGFEHRRCLVSQQVSTYLSWHCIHHYVKDVLVLTRPTCNVFLISLSLSLFMAVYSMHKHFTNLFGIASFSRKPMQTWAPLILASM